MKKAKLFLSGLALLFICFGMVSAEGIESKTLETLPAPDLVIKSVNFVPIPKEGGSIDLVKISVMNQGGADAGRCVLALSCMAIRCDEGNKCDEISRSISAEILVPPLKRGESIDLEWHPASSIRWVGGKYSVSADIDKYSVVQESNEANNICKSLVYINSFSPRPSPNKT